MGRAGSFVVNVPGLPAELGKLRALGVELDRVASRAVARVTREAGATIRRRLADAVGAKESAIARKKRVTAKARREAGLIWIGLQPLLPTHLGGPVQQTETGVTVAGRTYIGAFHAAVYGPERKVWIRLRSRHYDADLYPYRPRAAGAIDAERRHRFPVVLGRVKVDTAAVRDMLEDETRTAQDRLSDLVAHELGVSL